MMDALEKYNQVFIDTFQVGLEDLNEAFDIDTVANWDSVMQLSLVTSLEDEFDIMLDSEDILDFKSYSAGKEILAKYGVSL
jgi:acyl carrier protein